MLELRLLQRRRLPEPRPRGAPLCEPWPRKTGKQEKTMKTMKNNKKTMKNNEKQGKPMAVRGPLPLLLHSAPPSQEEAHCHRGCPPDCHWFSLFFHCFSIVFHCFDCFPGFPVFLARARTEGAPHLTGGGECRTQLPYTGRRIPSVLELRLPQRRRLPEPRPRSAPEGEPWPRKTGKQ